MSRVAAVRVLRELLTWTVLALVVAAGGGFAWLTRHPDAPLLARAAEWPVLGAAARAFRARWLPPPGSVVLEPGGDPGPTVSRVVVPVREVEVQDFFDLPERPEDPRAVAWADLSTEPWHGSGAPPLGQDPVPVGPLPGRPADPARLAEAVSFFDTPPRPDRLGGYTLLSDLDDGELHAALERAVEQVEPLWVSRYGVELRGEARETIVLYRSEDAYRRLQGRTERIGGLDSRGHTGFGMVALYADGDSPPADVVTVLRHELGHLLARRSLGPALPPWLDEGLADDFAAFELGPTLAPREASLDALRTVYPDRVEKRGALAGLELLAGRIAAGTAPPLTELLALEWGEFVAEPGSALHYASASWLVRYLLEERSGHRLAFRAFLRQVGRGGAGTGADLSGALGCSWPALESGFRGYVLERAAASGVAPAASS